MLAHDHTVMFPASLLFLAACLSLVNKRWSQRLTLLTLGCTMVACGAALAQDDAPQQVVLSTGSNVGPLDGLGFGGGIAVVNTGHRHPAVMKRVYEQLEAFTHTCAMVMP